MLPFVLRLGLFVLIALGLHTTDTHAAGKLRVVATTTDLKALTDVVGGDLDVAAGLGQVLPAAVGDALVHRLCARYARCLDGTGDKRR